MLAKVDNKEAKEKIRIITARQLKLISDRYDEATRTRHVRQSTAGFPRGLILLLFLLLSFVECWFGFVSFSLVLRVFASLGSTHLMFLSFYLFCLCLPSLCSHVARRWRSQRLRTCSR
jgi:hypothetical protein